MNEAASSTAGTILAALAVSGPADAVLLSAVLGEAVNVNWLLDQADVQWQGETFSLEPAAAETVLTSLERDDLPRYRWLHERAITALAGRLRMGESAAETPFMAALDRLANRLVLDEPAALHPLMLAIGDVPLATAGNRQLCRYFAGLALGLADQYGEAITALDGLLADTELAGEVRGRALNARAVFCRYTGRLAEALAGYEASLALWQRLGNRLRQGIALLNQGIVTYQLQEYQQAEGRLVAAAGCFEEVGASQWQAAVKSELGLVYRDLGRLDDALACFEAVAAQRRAENVAESLGRVLINLSETMLWQGQFSAAAQKAEEALALLSNRLYAVDAYLALGLAHQLAGQLPVAQAAFEAALALAAGIERRDILAEVHYRLGEALRRQGNDKAALTHYEAAAATVEASRRPLSQEATKISLLGRWQQIYETLVLHCLALGDTAAALAWTERARARAFAEAVAEDKVTAAGPGRQGDKEIGDPLVSLSPPPLVSLYSYFTTGVIERGLPLLRMLPAGSPLREQLLPPAHTLVFVQRDKQLEAFDCQLDPNLLASLSPRGNDRSRFLVPAVLRHLYSVLLKGTQGNSRNSGELGGTQEEEGAQTVVVVPHGTLHEIPFAALADESGRPFLRRGGPALVYAPSVTMAGLRPNRPVAPTLAPQSCLAVGYDGPGTAGLRHPEAEARWIATLTGGEAWWGPAAKAADLQRAAGRYRWLHIACHGLFNEQSPLDSYLETGAAERLTAREVLQNWQLQATLVTLSACQTGVSRILRSDEPMGLVRAFLVAGAANVLVSQWPVADLPAFLLMRFLYEQMMAGLRPAAALQVAQIRLRELPIEEVQAIAADLPAADLAGLPPHPFAHPMHWAAFMLVGRA